MKKLAMLSLYLISHSCHAQLFSIASDNNNVLYAGIENPLTIIVQNISPKAVFAKTDNGTLTGSNGHFTFYTDTGSIAHITLFKREFNKEVKIGVVVFNVRQIPDPRVRLGAYMGGNIPLAVLKAHAQNGITTDIATYYYRKGLPITSFTLDIIRNGNYVFKEVKNEGSVFNLEVQRALGQAMAGDAVIFDNIFAKRHDGTTTILSPLTFLIK